MAPRSTRNTTRSGNSSDAYEVPSRLDESQHKGKHQENLDEYDMLDIIAAIHALGEVKKEINAFVKELKSSILKLSEKANDKDCTPREKAS
ncbi:hypothetical protein C1H46_003968 [Malus baccata]|uniref:Uncharacterized protein n=1 Tax=Malus baccata TaxID=106549 RepID=A0A540NH52_MALBA|nr:hypothetical protein C1H46_003968 [Malus baccata]